MQQAAKGQGQDKNIDEQQIEWKEPDRPLEVRLVDVLDDDDLELARQKNNGQAGKDDQRGPRSRPAGIELQQATEIGARRRPLEQIAEPTEQAVSNEQADRHEGDKLDHRLKSHSSDHALVALGGIEMTRPEEDGEEGQHNGHEESRIQSPDLDAVARMFEQHINAGRHRLQLQGDVRNDANDRNHCHHAGQQLTLAVARSNEIGNGGNPLRLADTDHFEDNADTKQHQRRPDVDGQERQATGGRPPDTAVESP